MLFRFNSTMLHKYCTLLLFCFVAVRGKPTEPPVPSDPIGPFDNQEGKTSDFSPVVRH